MTDGADARAAMIAWKRAWVRAALLGLLLAFALPAARAAEHSGMRFDESARVGGAELLLNGLGLRSLFILKMYVAGLYVPSRSAVPADLLAQTGPRRLELKMLMEMSSDRMIKSLRDGLALNHDEEQLNALKPQVDQLAEAMRSLGTARKGDTVDIDLVDGQTSVSLNGQPRGQPIAGEDFYGALLRVFIGPRAADKEMKRGLLGG